MILSHRLSLIHILSLFLLVCSGEASAQNLGAGWAKEFVNPFTNTVAVDGYGNVYTVGYFNGPVNDFEPGPGVNNIASNGFGADMFISKFDAAGALLWVKTIPVGYAVTSSNMAVDPAGDVFVTAGFMGTVDFDPGPGVFTMTAPPFAATNLPHAFVLSLDASGSFVWAIQLETPSYGSRIFRNAAGDLSVYGRFAGTADFDPGAGTLMLNGSVNTNTFPDTVFLWKLTPSGALVKAAVLPGYQTKDVFQDPGGDVYITGRFWGTVDFDPGPGVTNLTAGPSVSVSGFVSKLDTSWNLLWATSYQGLGHSTPFSITTDGLGNVYTFGEFDGPVDFDPGSGVYSLMPVLNYVSASNKYIAKLDPSGNFEWALRLNPYIIWGNTCQNIAGDNVGNIYLGGEFFDTVDFDPGPGVFQLVPTPSVIPFNNTSDLFITKLDPSGSMEWTVSMAGHGGEICQAIKVEAGNIYCVGSLDDTVDFDPGPGVYEVPVPSLVHATFLLKFPTDSCANMGLVLDSLRQISCANPVGVIGMHTTGANAPYSYAWNTAPPLTAPVIPVTSGGLYQLTVTDNLNCERIRTFSMNPGPSQSGFDLNLNLVTGDFMPGFNTNIYVDAFNDGCVDVSGTFKLALDAQVNYSSASPMPDQITGDTLIWNFTNMNTDDGHFTAVVHVETDVTAILGSAVCVTGMAMPDAGDVNPLNNIETRCDTVTGSYDPNDIAVDPRGACEEGYVLPGTRLTYKIRFQNTGTASAVNVAVLDSLDANLNPASIKIVGSSHPMYAEILPGDVIKFNFDNIMLPDSNSNEPASHGYLIYEINPDAALANGTEINARADIYFDFNVPVLTNTIRNTVMDPIPSCIVSVQQPKTSVFKLYPNPAASSISVIYDQPGVLVLTDITGRIQKEIRLLQNSSMATVDVSGLVSGMYTYSFITKTTRQNGKLVILRSN